MSLPPLHCERASNGSYVTCNGELYVKDHSGSAIEGIYRATKVEPKRQSYDYEAVEEVGRKAQ